MQRMALAVRRDVQFAPEPFAEQRAVRQIGQRIVMGEVGDAFLGPAAFGDVLVGRHPAAERQRLVDDLDRSPVRGRDHHRVAQCDVAQHEPDIMLDVALERAGGLAMGDDVVEGAAGFHDVRRQSVHLYIALVADHEALF